MVLKENFGSLRASSSAPTCKVITRESLVAAQKEVLQRVMGMLSLREHHARTLLIHYRWNVEKLMTIYVEKGQHHLFSEAGIRVIKIVDLNVTSPSSNLICAICMDDVLFKDTTTMDCGHCFCNTCWTEHFIVKIIDGQSKRIRCMAEKCNAICDEDEVRKLVGIRELDLAEKFERFLLESYIEDNKMVKWCPSVPHCGNAIRVEKDTLCEVECSCGLQFCFSCLAEAHSPCSCLMWELWAKKCHIESATINWMTANAKPCPTCHKPVEKSGGCNVVMCSCGQPFSWLYGGKKGEDHARSHEDSKMKPNRSWGLYTYWYCYNRYKEHTFSFGLQAGFKETTEAKVSNLKARDLDLRDFSWISNGLYRLFTSRRALAYSYPFAYYMFNNEVIKREMTVEELEIKQHLFEYQQQQLESNIEKLFKFLCEPFDGYSEDQIMKIRIQVINLTVITDILCKKLYDCIENDLLGLDTMHNIVPYRSQGVEKAEHLISTQANSIDKYQETADELSGKLLQSYTLF